MKFRLQRFIALLLAILMVESSWSLSAASPLPASRPFQSPSVVLTYQAVTAPLRSGLFSHPALSLRNTLAGIALIASAIAFAGSAQAQARPTDTPANLKFVGPKISVSLPRSQEDVRIPLLTSLVAGIGLQGLTRPQPRNPYQSVLDVLYRVGEEPVTAEEIRVLGKVFKTKGDVESTLKTLLDIGFVEIGRTEGQTNYYQLPAKVRAHYAPVFALFSPFSRGIKEADKPQLREALARISSDEGLTGPSVPAIHGPADLPRPVLSSQFSFVKHWIAIPQELVGRIGRNTSLRGGHEGQLIFPKNKRKKRFNVLELVSAQNPDIYLELALPEDPAGSDLHIALVNAKSSKREEGTIHPADAKAKHGYFLLEGHPLGRRFLDAAAGIPEGYSKERARAIRDWLFVLDREGKANHRRDASQPGMGTADFKLPQTLKSGRLLVDLLSDAAHEAHFLVLVDQVNPERFLAFELDVRGRVLNSETGEELPQRPGSERGRINPVDFPEARDFFLYASRELSVLHEFPQGGLRQLGPYVNKPRSAQRRGLAFTKGKPYALVKVAQSNAVTLIGSAKTGRVVEPLDGISQAEQRAFPLLFLDRRIEEEETIPSDIEERLKKRDDHYISVPARTAAAFLGVKRVQDYFYYKRLAGYIEKDGVRQAVYRRLLLDDPETFFQAQMIDDEHFFIEGVRWAVGPQAGETAVFNGYISADFLVGKYADGRILELPSSFVDAFYPDDEQMARNTHKVSVPRAARKGNRWVITDGPSQRVKVLSDLEDEIRQERNAVRDSPLETPLPSGYDPTRRGDDIHFFYTKHASRSNFEDIVPLLTQVLGEAESRGQRVHVLLEGEIVQPSALFSWGNGVLLDLLDRKTKLSRVQKERALAILLVLLQVTPSLIEPEDAAIDLLSASLSDRGNDPIYARVFEQISRLNYWARLRFNLRNPESYESAYMDLLRRMRRANKRLVRHIEILPLEAQLASVRYKLSVLRSGMTWEQSLRALAACLPSRRAKLLEDVRSLKQAESDSMIIVIRGSHHRLDHRDLVETNRFAVWTHGYTADYMTDSSQQLIDRFESGKDEPSREEIDRLEQWSRVELTLNETLTPVIPHEIKREVAVNRVVRWFRDHGLGPDEVMADTHRLSEVLTDASMEEFDKPVIESRLESPTGPVENRPQVPAHPGPGTDATEVASGPSSRPPAKSAQSGPTSRRLISAMSGVGILAILQGCAPSGAIAGTMWFFPLAILGTIFAITALKSPWLPLLSLSETDLPLPSLFAFAKNGSRSNRSARRAESRGSRAGGGLAKVIGQSIVFRNQKFWMPAYLPEELLSRWGNTNEPASGVLHETRKGRVTYDYLDLISRKRPEVSLRISQGQGQNKGFLVLRFENADSRETLEEQIPYSLKEGLAMQSLADLQTGRRFLDAAAGIPAGPPAERAKAIRDWLVDMDKEGRAIHHEGRYNTGLGSSLLRTPVPMVSGQVLSLIISEKEARSRYSLFADPTDLDRFVVMESRADGAIVDVATGELFPARRNEGHGVPPIDSPTVRRLIRQLPRELMASRQNARSSYPFRQKAYNYPKEVAVGFSRLRPPVVIKVAHVSAPTPTGTKSSGRSVIPPVPPAEEESESYPLLFCDPSILDEETVPASIDTLLEEQPDTYIALPSSIEAPFLGRQAGDGYGYYKRLTGKSATSDKSVYRRIDKGDERVYLKGHMVDQDHFVLEGVRWTVGPHRGEPVHFTGRVSLAMLAAKYINERVMSIPLALHSFFAPAEGELIRGRYTVPAVVSTEKGWIVRGQEVRLVRDFATLSEEEMKERKQLLAVTAPEGFRHRSASSPSNRPRGPRNTRSYKAAA